MNILIDATGKPVCHDMSWLQVVNAGWLYLLMLKSDVQVLATMPDVEPSAQST